MENSKDLKDIFHTPISRRNNQGEDLYSDVIGYSSEESEEEEEEEEEIMENNPLDKIIPNHKELSREEIGKEIFKFVNKINDDPEVIKQNEEMQHNALMKLLGIIKNEAPSKSPITLRTLQKEFIDMGEKYNNESSESEEEEEEEEEK
jgi:hypothetical protein